MSSVQVFILSAMESSCLFILWNKMNNNFKKESWVKKVIGILGIAFIVMLTDAYNLYLGFMVNYIFLVLFSCLLFQISIKNLFLLFLMSFSMVAVIELLIFVCLSPFISNPGYTFKQGLIINTISFILCVFLNYFIPFPKIELLYKKYNKILWFSFINISLIFFVFLYFWQGQDNAFNWKYALTPFGIGSIWSAINLYFLYQNIKIQKQREIISIHTQYQKSLVELVDEVRQKQHDYKNHLNALYGLAQLDDPKQTQQELATYLDQYIDTIQNTDQILNIKDPILSALIYSKKKVAQSHGIEFELIFVNEIPHYPLLKYELVEVIGNLLDNAIEGVQGNGKNFDGQSKISISLGMEKNKKFIQVKNTFFNPHQVSPKRLFEKNFSTKRGNNRGYGLYLVKKIIDSYGGRITISMDSVFSIEIVFET